MLAAKNIAPCRVRPVRRAEYDQLVEVGAFSGERIQLVEGVLVEMSPQGTEHSGVIQRLTRLFIMELGRQCEVRVQLPFAATDDSEPEPDVALVPRGDYFETHPSTAFLIVEVAGDSRSFDLGPKARVCARAGVPDYWVVDLKKNEVVVHRRPSRAGRYASVRALRPGKRLSSLEFPKLEREVAFFLPG